ncbi:hypothetical protein ACHAXA_005503 [Cyclostephanos tholiformis]|uniref:Uncharacterized protein n=1 Tax=Cyclostephanos tholiformis TaxID=382380 RepID=A0ABD3RVC8_9STRA
MKLLAHRLNLLLDRSARLVEKLEFTSSDEYLAALTSAVRDARVAWASSWNLARLTIRPAWILGGMICRCLAAVLRIVARHTVAHGWIAAREGLNQMRAATVWFVGFQRDLPTSAKYAEVGAAASMAMLWLLRRHVRRRRYVERIATWYGHKKRGALRKYRNLVERVARTSSFLAALLPHLMYAALVVGLKELMPSVVTYFATRTYLRSIISFWHPLYLTISLLGRLSPHLRDYKDAKATRANESDKSTKSSRERTETPSTLKQRRQREKEMETLRVEVIDMLKYWVVYAVLLAIVRTGRLLPIVGHVLNVSTEVDSTTVSKGFFGKVSRAGFYTKLRLRGKFVDEATLVFFIWLCFMPASIAGDEVKQSITKVLSSKRPIPIESKPDNVIGGSRPVDILYRKLSPAVLATINSSAFLKKGAIGDCHGKESTFVSMAIQKFHSILDLFVLVRLISKESQDWLITTIVESSALLPALTTLFMPSYFTNYGVIYVSLVVPAGYTISSCDAIQITSQSVETTLLKINDSARYLQFWIVHAAVSMILASFGPILAWIPLSTHATWLLWAYVQLQSSTIKIYGWFEGELTKKSLSETAVARSTRWIIAVLPSNVKGDAEPHEAVDTPKLEGEKSKDV